MESFEKWENVDKGHVVKALLLGTIAVMMVIALIIIISAFGMREAAGVKTVSDQSQPSIAQKEDIQEVKVDVNEGEDFPIDWQDDVLEEAVRNATGITDRKIMVSDVKKITELEENQAIGNLQGLQYFSNLETLSIGGSDELKDISVLGELKNLKTLCIKRGEKFDDERMIYSYVFPEIGDIEALSKLTNLENISLSGTGIKDISALSKLIHLKELDLSGNYITDISVLSELTNLEVLNLSNTKITDISALAKLINLKKLDLSRTEVKDISILKDMPNLQELYI